MNDTKRNAAVPAGLAIAVLALVLACAPPAPVIQGPVVSVDRAAKTVTVRNELRPADPPMTANIGKAEIGAEPKVGDTVRLVYRTEAAKNVALRVMNLTQQKELAEKGK